MPLPIAIKGSNISVKWLTANFKFIVFTLIPHYSNQQPCMISYVVVLFVTRMAIKDYTLIMQYITIFASIF